MLSNTASDGDVEHISERTYINNIPTFVAISDSATTLDPTGMLLGKQSQMIATVNVNDFEDLITSLGSEEQALQYIEMISGKPVYNSSHAELRESFISSPVSARSKFKYYDNSWTNNSWAKIQSDILRGEMRDGSLYNEVPAVFWTKNTHKSDPFSGAYDELMITLDNIKRQDLKRRFMRLEYDTITALDTTNQLTKIFENFIDENWDAREIHVWIQGSYKQNGKDYKPAEVIDILSVKARELYKQEVPPSIVDLTLTEDVMYWADKWGVTGREIQSGITASRLNYVSYWYGESRVPISKKTKVITPKMCIPFRVSEYNLLERNEEKYAQMYPQTSIMQLLKSEEDKLTYRKLLQKSINKMSDVMFTNYSKHVIIERVRQGDTFDFVYEMVGPGIFKVTTMQDVTKVITYKISNVDIFMGTGSVITTHHRVYGLARDKESLWRQYQSKQTDGISTSGHMIAAQLALTTHLLWYLLEVLYNVKMKKSVYILSVNEPTDDIYHSKAEYMKAFNEVNLTYNSRSRSALSAALTPLNMQISKLIVSQLV